ncbi:hypothetical protein [Mesorhizobium sp. ES1-1]|uniref:hypothetical protein n=1 Tax=Mesorhizobium sp. ES1-1 TaxID=2876629 RepID=UPI001CC95503|nr:hypothetical protein [Mesorhizobium sp. ES1-1]MBZ9675205.1 hypothetical protein [Mesorhizobium sp. ES1-1]
MTAFLRNTLLAAAALSSLAGSAMADQTIPSCASTNLQDLWSGRCCSASSSDCHGARRHRDNGRPGQNGGGNTAGGDHHDNGGRGDNGGNNGGSAGKP